MKKVYVKFDVKCKPGIMVIYPGKPKVKLDKKITEFFESLGYRWYAQGYDFEAKERDIVFDGKLKVKRIRNNKAK